MKIQQFFEQLSEQYVDWGTVSIQPKSKQFQEILEQFEGETTAAILQLLNWAVACLEPGELYCEVGCGQGSNLIGALLDHPDAIAYAIDHFSASDPDGTSLETLETNLSNFNLTDQVLCCNQTLEEFFLSLRELELVDKIGVYFCQGVDDYRSQLLGFLLVRPFLAEQALMIVEGSNRTAVQQASWDFMAAYPDCKLILDLPTPYDRYFTFWNGIYVLSWNSQEQSGTEQNAIQHYRHIPFLHAMQGFCGDFEAKQKQANNLCREADDLWNLQNLCMAAERYQETLKLDSSNAIVWQKLGSVYYEMEQYPAALDALKQSLKLEILGTDQSIELGLIHEAMGDIDQAMVAYQQAIDLEPTCTTAYNHLGNLWGKAGNIELAESLYKQAITANPDYFSSYLNLGNILMKGGETDQAITAYQTALQLSPSNPDILNHLAIAFQAKQDEMGVAFHLGFAFYYQGKYKEAAEQYRKFLEKQPDHNLSIILSDCYRNSNQYIEAHQVDRAAVALYPESPQTYLSLIKTLEESGLTQEAIAAAREASSLFPDDWRFSLEVLRILPIVYESEAEIHLYRRQFIQGLEALLTTVCLDSPQSQSSALLGIGCRTNFYLQYQCQNDRDLQVQYGDFVHRVMAANYPQWTVPTPIYPLRPHEKIRVGYISHYLWNHNGANWALGWIRHHQREQFEVFCYHTGETVDSLTARFSAYSDRFHHLPNNLESVCQQIISDQPHILVFTDIGMAPLMTQMAGLRLAPVQCTAWGHPITSGLPTVDYYLSSDLMEPDNAQEHYSEQLVRLPNIGLCYTKPRVPQTLKARSDFQLRQDAVVYLCCQSLFKYLPQYDSVLVAIASQVPNAQFVFLSHPSTPITQKFQQRLQRAFAQAGLESQKYCVILPRQNYDNFVQLNAIADIFLDTFDWNGGNTTLLGIACHLPIVTCPGAFMRGRHSYAFLKRLEVTETIAQDEAEYIKIAVRLGLDPAWRRAIVQKMSLRHDDLYEDKTCVTALEAFYERVVRQGQFSNRHEDSEISWADLWT
ncbi:MAG: tetratricopeptide repeat protein [Leptolyngbyaceae bacterium]|nr:tetratricopeptide repeat protein [Leptolyngbyaceae bacterium]